MLLKLVETLKTSWRTTAVDTSVANAILNVDTLHWLKTTETGGGAYRRGLYPLGNRGNAPPEGTQSLPASSRESSTEPMDMDDARRASVEIYRRIRQQAGLSRSGSVGDVTLQPAPSGIMTQGKLILRRGMPEQTQAEQPSVESPEMTAGATGGKPC